MKTDDKTHVRRDDSNKSTTVIAEKHENTETHTYTERQTGN
jgi:hypothetical protein